MIGPRNRLRALKAEANRLMATALAAYEAVGIPVKPEKVEAADLRMAVLGMSIDGHLGRVGVSPKRRRRLEAGIRQLLRLRACNGRALSCVVGQLTRAFLVRRPLLSILWQCYRLIRALGNRAGRPWPEVRAELATSADVLTLAWAKVDNAPPEKKPMLLATVGNVGRMLQLRKQVKTDEANLKEAVKLLAKAEADRADSTAKRQRVLQDWKQLQNVWRDKNRNYWKTHSNNIRMASQVRTRRSAVERTERTLRNAQRTLDRHKQKLETFEKDVARGNIKLRDKKDEQRKRDSYLRPIKQAEKSIRRAQGQLESARRDDKKIQDESRPLPEEEKLAKKTLDQAKKESDQAMQAYRKTIADYQVSSRQAGIARSRVSELQQKKDQTARELEELRSKVPAFSPDK